MFKKILVPLDGSELAERALEPAFRLAHKFGGEVILLRVTMPEPVPVELPALAPRPYAQFADERGRHQEEAEAYVYGIKMHWLGAGVPVWTEVAAGAPPEMIAAVAREAGVDLIVMSTHGRTGFSRLVYGSVAEAVLRGAHVPLLLVPSKV